MYPEALCLTKTSFDIEGDYEQKRLSFLRVQVIPCVNSSSNNFSCKPKEIIHEYFSGKKLGYTFIDYQVDIENLESPIRSKFSLNFKFIEPLIRKRIIHWIDKIIVRTDASFLFREYETQTFWEFGNVDEDFDYYNQTSIFEINIRSSNISKIYTRRYTKIQDALASLGGIFNFLILMGFFIMKLIPVDRIQFIIANRLFLLKKENEKTPTNFDKLGDESKIISFNLSNFTNRFPKEGQSKENMKNDLNITFSERQILSCSQENGKNSEFSDSSQQTKKLKFLSNLRENFMKYLNERKESSKYEFSIKALFEKNSRNFLISKLKTFYNARNELDEQINIIHILEKLQEIDKLKSLLLDPVQLFFFNQFSKPSIFSISENKSEICPDSKILEEYLKYYERLKENRLKNEENLESRLLDLIDPEFRLILEN